MATPMSTLSFECFGDLAPPLNLIGRSSSTSQALLDIDFLDTNLMPRNLFNAWWEKGTARVDEEDSLILHHSHFSDAGTSPISSPMLRSIRSQ